MTTRAKKNGCLNAGFIEKTNGLEGFCCLKDGENICFQTDKSVIIGKLTIITTSKVNHALEHTDFSDLDARFADSGLYVAVFLPKGWIAPETVNWTAAIIFALAAVTDWFDGFLARLWKQTSDFGAFLDPVADKLMVATALLLLVSLWSYLCYLRHYHHRQGNHHFRFEGMDGANGQTQQRCRCHHRQI